MSSLITRLYNFVNDRIASVPITASRVDAELDQMITALNQKVLISSSTPSSPVAGMLWYDTTNKFLKQYRNGEWVIMAPAHYSSSAPSTTQAGDIWLDSSGSEVVAKIRNKANNGWITIVDTASGFVTPTGGIMLWTTTTAPTGYLICDGSAVSRTTYAALFAVVSTTFGVGDGSTTFNLPNMKGKVPVGRDSGDTDFDNIGDTGGAKTHTLSTAEMPAHTHGITSSTGGAQNSARSILANDNPAPAATDSAGGGGAHNNLQPFITLSYIIKT